MLPTGHDKPQQRTDIQFLRAISVSCVIFYHCGFSAFSGGFLGVDIFFVISGFLITSMLLKELSTTGSINLWRFWMRRAWRLLPNALCVLIFVLVLSLFLLPVDKIQTIGDDLLSSLFYFANYRFAARSVDYFDDSTGSSPALHFWSLSVEEQFYLIWPLIIFAIGIWFVKHRSTAIVATMIVLFLSSFAVHLITSTYNTPLAFFGTGSRVWQLMVGAILASQTSKLSQIPMSVRSVLVTAAMVLLAVFIATFHLDNTYSSWLAPVPVGAAGMVIAIGVGGASSWEKIFRWKPFQWVGDRSYSLYLWHWPVLVFGKTLLPNSSYVLVVELLVLVGLATLSYAFVENPLRHSFSGTKRNFIHSRSAVLFSVVGVVAVSIYLLTHFPIFQGANKARLVEQILQAKQDQLIPNTRGCASGWGSKITGCRFGDSKGDQLAILFGDSHAAHLFPGVELAAKEEGWALHQWTKNSCPPIELMQFSKKNNGPDKACAKWLEEAIIQLIEVKPDLVIVSSWTGPAKKMIDGYSGEKLSRPESFERWGEGFSAVLKRLTDSGLKVAVVLDTPRGRFGELEQCAILSDPRSCNKPKNRALNLVPVPELAVISNFPDVEIVDLSPSFCRRNICYSVIDGQIVYRDNAHHLTATFAKSLKSHFSRLFNSVP